MFRRIIDRIKEAVEYLMSSRLIVLIIVFCLTSSILIGRLFYLQIVRGEDYLENYELQIRKTRTVPGTRGNIFDRNGEVIAYNELAYSVTIEDIIPTDTKTEDKNKILNDTLDSVLSIVEENGDSVIDNFGIILDSSGSYQFAETNETSRLRFVADVHGKSFIDDLTEKEKNKTAFWAVLFFILFCNFHHNLIGTCDKLRHTIRRECAVSKSGKIIQLLAVLCNRLILSMSQNILNKRMCKI